MAQSPVVPTPLGESCRHSATPGQLSLFKIRVQAGAMKCSQISGRCRIERMEMIGMRLPITARKPIPPFMSSIVWPFPLSAAFFHATAITFHKNHSRTLLLVRNAERALVNRGGQPLAWQVAPQ
jgi:hypothetical protein